MSIRARITATAVVTAGIVLTLMALAVVVSQRSRLTAALDATLRQRADDITALVTASDSLPIELGASRQEGFVQLLDAGGSVLAASPNLGSAGLPIDYTIGGDETVRTLADLPVDDDAFRVLSRTLDTPLGPATLHVGTTYDVVGDSTEALVTSLVVSIPIAVALLAGMVWMLVGRTLRPVEDIRAEVAAIGGGGLDRRVPQPASGDEIALLAATMNQMLERIEDSVDKQHRFVADASHELRSPLTRMRSEIEVDLATSPGGESERLESLLSEVIALQDLVADLLYLARSDAGGYPLSPERIDLDDLVLSEAQRLHTEGRMTVDVAGVAPVQVDGDEAQLTRAIRNLLDNAARHAAGRVTLTVGEEDGAAQVTVADDGGGIAPTDAELIFQRFTRIDDSRSRASGGSGLGLSIARDIVERHGGSIELDTAGRPGARFVVRLPRC